jgi:hypothetical protein
MENTPTGASPSPLAQALEETRAAACEQLSAAWQLQVERIEEQLHAGWREHVGQVFEERFAELAARLAQEFDHAVAERRAALEALSVSVRRLSHAQASGEWAEALLDGVAPHCRRCLLFTVALRSLIAEGARGFDQDAAAEWSGREVRLESAPALAAAVETRDVVVALRSAGEISAELAALTGESDQERAHLYPVLARGRCAALLYVDPARDDSAQAAVELLVAVAGLSLGARPLSTALVAIEAAAAASASAPDWYAALPLAERELHLRAKRFARVQAAEMRLFRSAEVRGGRARQNLYQALQGPIDKAREAFHRQFLAACPSMVDYLHQELVRTLANGDAAALGSSYPGPLV